MLGIKCRASGMRGRCYTIQLWSYPTKLVFKNVSVVFRDDLALLGTKPEF